MLGFRIIYEKDMWGLDHGFNVGEEEGLYILSGCWNVWLGRANSTHWVRQSREKGFWGRWCIQLFMAFVFFKIDMILERELIKLSSYLKLVMLLLGREKEEKEKVGGLTEVIPNSLACPDLGTCISETYLVGIFFSLWRGSRLMAQPGLKFGIGEVIVQKFWLLSRSGGWMKSHSNSIHGYAEISISLVGLIFPDEDKASLLLTSSVLRV